jgi:transcription initiation factor TFIIB
MEQNTQTPKNSLNTSSRIEKDAGNISHPVRRTVEGHTRPCEDCGAVDWQLDASRGEITCNACGLVVEENVIDPGAEWTNRDRSQDCSCVG